jgi:hypothetical protein
MTDELHTTPTGGTFDIHYHELKRTLSHDASAEDLQRAHRDMEREWASDPEREQLLEEEDNWTDEDWDADYDPESPDPYMVQHGLEKIYRIDMAYSHCDDPEIKGLLEQALPLLWRAQELNDQKIAGLEEK